MSAPRRYPLAWPPAMPRNPKPMASQFEVTLARAINDLGAALAAFGKDTGKPVTGVVISSNVTLGEESPKDAGVAVYFDWDGAQRCIAVDRYLKVRENVRAIWAVLEARRTEMRHGGLNIVRAAFAGFTALPPPTGADGQPVITESWRAVLGFEQVAGVTMDNVTEVYRSKAKAASQSPDAEAAIKRLNLARDAAKRELAA